MRKKLKRVLAAAAVGTVALAGGVLTDVAPAQAATYGAGGNWSNYGGWIGNYIMENGTFGYCIDPVVSTSCAGGPGELSWDTGTGPEGNTRPISGAELQMVNYAISYYGQTADPVQAAAVNFFVWDYASVNQYGNSIDHYLGGGPVDAIRASYAAVRAGTFANYNQGGGGTGTGDLRFNVDGTNNYNGTVTVENLSPADATGTITLTNAVFADTGLATREGVGNNSTFPVRGVPPEGQSNYSVSGSGDFTGSGSVVYGQDIRIHSAGAMQRCASPGNVIPGISEFQIHGEDPQVSAEFRPVLGTQVSSQIVRPGEQFADVLTFDIVADADGMRNEWLQNPANGNYAPITAVGTIYGPLSQEPVESATAPADAPVAASGIELTTGAEGPTVPYTVQSGLTSTTAGWYTWVWEIRAADQRDSVRPFLPTDYHFIDAFGQAVETSFTPMTVSAVSQVEEPVVSPGDSVRDTLTVSSNGWLDGIEARFEGRVYATTDGTIPAQSATVPTDNVRLVDMVEIIATGPGTYTSPEVIVPEDAGHLVWVWSFDASQQADPSAFPAGFTWRDDWAVPEETQRVLFEPALTTRAVVEVPRGAEFVDVIDAFAASGQWIDGTDVRASGTLYGPMLAAPEESAEAPSWAMIAGTAEIILDRAGEHTVTSGIVSEEAGFYTWVWEIDSAAQSVETQARIAPGYYFRDTFAQVVETSITPSEFAPVSKVTKPQVALSEGVQDTLDVQLAASSGGWLQVNRQRVPVVFHGTAYFVPGETAPAVSAYVPAGAEVLGTSQITATGPGLYESAILPGETHRKGWITWVWEIRAADQPEEYRQLITEWADSFGLPDETHEVLVPEITTQAQPEAAIGERITDTAIVTGTMPIPGMDIHFELYEATRGADGEWVCDAGNLLWTSEQTRITETGEYVSEPAPGQAPGEYHWVEVATAVTGEEISRGICGLENETTRVTGPEVTTQAQSAKIGAPIHDVATVTGPVVADSNLELTFEAYHVPMVKDPETGDWIVDAPEGATGLDWVCTAEPVFTTIDSPLNVTREGEYTSDAFVPEELGQYFWVETLTYVGGESPLEVHRGECGIREETSFVVDVTTKAQLTATAGEKIIDTAIVYGIFPEGSEIVFDAYKVAKDAPQFGEEGAAALCVDENLIERTESLEVPGGILHEGLEITSPEVTTPGSMTDYKVYWVERIVDETGTELASGECGLVNETTTVKAPPLPITGAAGIALLGVIGLLLVAGGTALVIVRRRNSREEVITATE